MNRDEALEYSDNALKELADALRQGKSDSLVKYLDSLAKFHRYSFFNCLLIATQRPDATLVAGFWRWKQLGRWVKNGEKGIAILAPLVLRKPEHRGEECEANDADDREPRTVRGFRVVHVFDVSQTDGKDLPHFGTVSGDPGEKTARIEDLIRSKGIVLEYVPSLNGALGQSSGGRISIVSSLLPAEQFSTLVHELAHELLHRGDRRSEATKVIRETEAEAVAYVVSKASGLELANVSADYIQLWNGDESVLLGSLELVRNVASQILTELETPAPVTEQLIGAGNSSEDGGVA